MKTLVYCLVTVFFIGCGSSTENRVAYSAYNQYVRSADARYAPEINISSNGMSFAKAKRQRQDVALVSISDSYAGSSASETNQDALAQQPSRTEPAPAEDPQHQRMVAYTASLYMAVDSMNLALQQITTICSRYRGYVESSSQNSMTIWVSAAHFDEALHDISVLGQVDQKFTNAVDVSEQFYDLETRLNTAENSRKRYLELLAKAENVEAALKVEHELERITETIETMKAQRERLKSRFMLSQISINLRELHPQHETRPGPLGYVAIGLYKAIEWLFVWH